MIDHYLRAIDAAPLLTADEERDLATRARAGDADARDRLVRANLRLVVSVARRFARRCAGTALTLEDLIGEGNLGLLHAAGKFDPARGARFSTYATYWVEHSVRRALFEKARLVRIASHAEELLSRWRRAEAELRVRLGRPAAGWEIERRLGLTANQLATVRRAVEVEDRLARVGRPEAAGAVVGAGGRVERRGGERPEPAWDVGVVAGREGPPGDAAADADEVRAVLRRLGAMGRRRAAVVRMRFGLGGTPPMTLREVGAAVGVGRNDVSRIQAEALEALARAPGGAP